MFKLSAGNILIVIVSSGLLLSCAELKDAGKTIGHTTSDAAKVIGHGARDAGKAVGKGTKKVLKSVTKDE